MQCGMMWNQSKFVLRDITGMARTTLLGAPLGLQSVAQRMSWASLRTTARSEDMAYCLMGLFEVNIPMLYGEGEWAFIRLQEAIVMRSPDQSIIAWNIPTGCNSGLIAKSPVYFVNSFDIVRIHDSHESHSSITNRGIRISLPFIDDFDDHKWLVALKCRDDNNCGTLIALRLHPHSESTGHSSPYFSVSKGDRTVNIPSRKHRLNESRDIFISEPDVRQSSSFPQRLYESLRCDRTGLKQIFLQDTYPATMISYIIHFPPGNESSTLCAAIILRDDIGHGCLVAVHQSDLALELELSQIEASMAESDAETISREEYPKHHESGSSWSRAISSDREYWQHPCGEWWISTALEKKMVDGIRVLVLKIEGHALR